jgi:hypothetical protein
LNDVNPTRLQRCMLDSTLSCGVGCCRWVIQSCYHALDRQHSHPCIMPSSSSSPPAHPSTLSSAAPPSPPARHDPPIEYLPYGSFDPYLPFVPSKPPDTIYKTYIAGTLIGCLIGAGYPLRRWLRRRPPPPPSRSGMDSLSVMVEDKSPLVSVMEESLMGFVCGLAVGGVAVFLFASGGDRGRHPTSQGRNPNATSMPKFHQPDPHWTPPHNRG